MNIEELTSSIKDSGGSDLFANLSADIPSGKGTDDRNELFFNSKMAEASQFLVFEEIYKSKNSITYTDLEEKVYDRYDNILNKYNQNFIFSLKMPFGDWIKLQTELGNILMNIIEGENKISISKAIEELLISKKSMIYEVTKEKLTKKAS